MRKRIKKYILESSSNKQKHTKIQSNNNRQTILVNTLNMFNPQIIRL